MVDEDVKKGLTEQSHCPKDRIGLYNINICIVYRVYHLSRPSSEHSQIQKS